MRILVINLMPYLGEMLFITPVFRALREFFPEATIDALVERRSHEVIRFNPHLDAVITMERHGTDRGIAAMRRLALMIRRHRYDLVLDFTGSERSMIIAILSGAKFHGFIFGFLSLFLPHTLKVKTIHSVDAYFRVLTSIGLPEKPSHGMEIYFDQTSAERADALWRENALPETGAIGIHPSAGAPEKAWTVAGLAELTSTLAARDWPVVILGGVGDLGLAGEIRAQTSGNPVVLTGRLNLLELAAVIKKCRVFVSGDSGPLHVASALGVPAVALFGPTDPARYRPYRSPHILIQAPDRSMASITTENVLRAVEQLYADAGQGA